MIDKIIVRTILIVILIVFIPWATGQYEYVRIRKEYPKDIQIILLEKLVTYHPDIYAIEHLANLQIEKKKTKELQKTLGIIERLIPRYTKLKYTIKESNGK